MSRTSDTRQRILDYMEQYTLENGYAPSMREIQNATGLRSVNTVSYHLEKLRDEGLVRCSEGKGKKRAVSPLTKVGQIPIVGTVTAGVPILAVENREGAISWDGDKTCFALRVRGDSMVGAGILSGDLVVVRPQPTADNGQIVVALLEDEATVKRLCRKDGRVWLMPENENYQPIDGTNAQLLGLVKAVIREY